MNTNLTNSLFRYLLSVFVGHLIYIFFFRNSQEETINSSQRRSDSQDQISPRNGTFIWTVLMWLILVAFLIINAEIPKDQPISDFRTHETAENVKNSNSNNQYPMLNY